MRKIEISCEKGKHSRNQRSIKRTLGGQGWMQHWFNSRNPDPTKKIIEMCFYSALNRIGRGEGTPQDAGYVSRNKNRFLVPINMGTVRAALYSERPSCFK